MAVSKTDAHALAVWIVPLADACVTEWRMEAPGFAHDVLHVPLADACVTEWRLLACVSCFFDVVPLADACVTEWRLEQDNGFYVTTKCHSLMPVLLNGGLRSLICCRVRYSATR